jgi:flagellin
MGQVINTNVTSLFGQQSANKSTNDLRIAMARLSSGMRINTGRDDPTGMVSGSNYEKTMRGALVAQRMANEGLADMQTRDGFHAQAYENLQRMREIAVQSGGTAASTEYTVLAAENLRLLGLAGGAHSAYVIESGGTVTYTSTIAAATNVASGAIADINTAITNVTTARAGYGADMAKFASAAAGLGLEASNAAAQYSSVMDTDYAVETTNMTKASIKNQAANAMLAQANQIPNQVLALLRF